MAEQSMLWTTNGTGHGVGSGYSTARWQALLKKLFLSDQAANACVLNQVDNELAVSGTASPLAVATGAAVAHSFFYENDASKNLTVTTPVVGLTGGHVVLEANWAAQTVTALAVRNTDGVAAIPALTQIANTTWQVRLATFTITTGGAITLTDVRKRVKFSNHVYANGFDASAVDNVGIELASGALRLKDAGTTRAKLANGTALSVIGRSVNSAGVPADIAAVAASGAVLRESGSTIGFGTVATAGIANDAVDDTKVGNRVPQFVRRQGGDGNDWSIPGSSNVVPTTLRMQAGIIRLTWSGVGSTKTAAITFPVAFSNKPLIWVSIEEPVSIGSSVTFSCGAQAPTANGFTLYADSAVMAGTGLTFDFAWLAIGPE